MLISREPTKSLHRFEKMHPPPQWAVDARRKILRRRAAEAKHGGNAALLIDSDASDASSNEDDDSADEKDEVDDLFRKAAVGGKGGKKVKGGKIEPGEIDVDRVRDANQHEAKSVSRRCRSARVPEKALTCSSSPNRAPLSRSASTRAPKSSSLLLPTAGCVYSRSTAPTTLCCKLSIFPNFRSLRPLSTLPARRFS